MTSKKMGAVKVNKVSRAHNARPERRCSTQTFFPSQSTHSEDSSSYRTYLALFIGVLLASMTWLLYKQRQVKHEVSVHIALKVLDTEGHPIAGAQVHHGKTQLGVSDSFGDWQRDFRLSTGKLITLQVEKRIGAEKFYSQKTFMVSKGPTLDLTSNITLVTEVTAAPTSFLDSRNIWFAASDNSPQRITRLLTTLQQQAPSYGLTLDSHSPWQILLQSSGTSYVRVIAHIPGQEKKEDFLLTYDKGRRTLADMILKNVKARSLRP
jgi:hypothetical protein